MLRIVWILILVLTNGTFHVRSVEATSDTNHSESLTSASGTQYDNSTELQEVLSYGRGLPESVIWHPNGHVILVNTLMAGVWLYDIDNLSSETHLPALSSAFFSPDGRWLIGRNQDNKAEIRDYSNLESPPVLSDFAYAYFSPDSRYVFIWREGYSAKVELWAVAPFHRVEMPPAFARRYILVEWSPDGSSLAGIDEAGQLFVWQLEDSSLQYQRNSFLGADELSWNSDGRKLLIQVTDENLIHVLDARTGDLSAAISSAPRPFPLAPCGSRRVITSCFSTLLGIHPSCTSMIRNREIW